MASLKHCVAFIPVILFLGCARLGHDFPMERVGEIENGKSTREDVRRILGEPVHIGQTSDGSGWWGYQYIQSTAIGPVVDTKSKNFTVWFDANGVVSMTSEYRSKTRPFKSTEISSNTTASRIRPANPVCQFLSEAGMLLP